jgi:tetratricopeptide (TPR) repeat protein
MLKKLSCLVLLSVCCHASAGTDQWIELRSSHFTLYSDAGEKQARHTLDQLERMRWLYQTLFPKANVDPAEPIFVVAARNEKTFRTMEPADYLNRGSLNLGGYFQRLPDKNYILLRLDATFEHPFATVYHEYTHLQFAADDEWMPLWFNEGLAEFVQNTEIRDKDVLLGEPSANDILYLRQNRIIPLTTLFKVDHNSPYYHEDQKGSVFYAESWALTHYLMMTDHQNHTHRLQDYLELVSKNEDPVIAGEKAFGDLKRMQLELQSYISDARYQEFLLSSAASPIDQSSYTLKTLTDTQAQAVRADVLASIRRTDDARALLDSILKSDPNNVQALETMGSLAFSSGDHEEARKWYGQAVKLDSQNFLAFYHCAALSMEQPDRLENKEIETDLREAIRLNPRFARAYDLLAEYYAMRHENLDEAHVLNIKAVQLDPGNLYYRLNTANVLMTAQRYSDALAVLKGAVKLAKNPQETSLVQSRINEIQSFQAERARIEAEAKAQASAQTEARPVVTSFAADPHLKYPTMPVTGPKHVADGVIRGVACTLPAALEFRVEKPGKKFFLYINDFYKLDLSVLNFTPSGSMNPCADFEGMKARVEYVESSDKTVDGQVVSVELRK